MLRKLLSFSIVIALAVPAGADTMQDMLRKLKASERVEMRSPTSVAAVRGMEKREQFREEVNSEAVREQIRENIQATANEELKTAEFEEGKVMIDHFGKWVRVEQYIVRPAANQFKLMILNERENGARLDYFKHTSTFDKDLPPDLTDATRTMWESDTAPEYQLTDVDNLASNCQDTVKWSYSDGHWVETAGKTMFDNYVYKINDVTKLSYSGVNITDPSQRNWTIGNEVTPKSNDDFSTWLDTSLTSDKPDGDDVMCDKYEKNWGDTTKAWETYYIINENGETAKEDVFAGKTKAEQKAEMLANWNQELVFEATEFGDRKIDLVILPRIFYDSGIGQVK